jgi:hypothetical protein
MRRTVARTLSVLMVVLALALATLAAPASAGQLGGGFVAVTLALTGQPVGTCAYFRDIDEASPTFGHTFFGVVTGKNITIVGPLAGTEGIPAILPVVGLSSRCSDVTPATP